MIENILGRRIEEIDILFLIEFFREERLESDVLELKSFYDQNEDVAKDKFNDKQSDVLKTICGFLNSSGGVVIWGAPVGRKEGKNKVFLGGLSPVDRRIEKDSFINRLSDRTVPLPSDIRFLMIEVENGKFIYVIEVLPSITKPHQYDNRYYMRLDGQTRIAPHHYIEALFKQVKFPILEGYIAINSYEVRQEERVCAMTVSVYIFNFSPFLNEENAWYKFITNTDILIRSDNAKNPIKEGSVPLLHYGTPLYAAFDLKFTERDLNFFKQKVIFFLAFGGKNSPQKISHYELNFSKEIQGNNFSDLFVKIEENKFYHDFSKDNSETKEKILKDVLFR